MSAIPAIRISSAPRASATDPFSSTVTPISSIPPLIVSIRPYMYSWFPSDAIVPSGALSDAKADRKGSRSFIDAEM